MFGGVLHKIVKLTSISQPGAADVSWVATKRKKRLEVLKDR